jgi:hypothetical protein
MSQQLLQHPHNTLHNSHPTTTTHNTQHTTHTTTHHNTPFTYKCLQLNDTTPLCPFLNHVRVVSPLLRVTRCDPRVRKLRRAGNQLHISTAVFSSHGCESVFFRDSCKSRYKRKKRGEGEKEGEKKKGGEGEEKKGREKKKKLEVS